MQISTTNCYQSWTHLEIGSCNVTEKASQGRSSGRIWATVARFIKVQKCAGEKKDALEKAAVLPRVCPAAELVCSVRLPLDPRAWRLIHDQMVQLPLRRSLASSLQAHTHAHQAHQGPELQHQHPGTPPRALVAQPVSAPFQPAQLPSFPLHRPLLFPHYISLGLGKWSVFLSNSPISFLAFPSRALLLLWSTFWLLLCTPHSSASHLASAAHALSERTCPCAISPPLTPLVGQPGGGERRWKA